MTNYNAALEEEDIHYCAVHPDKETSLRCNKCERYMCVKCAVQTPVGYRCRECVRQIESKFYTANSADSIIIFVVCAAATAVAAGIVGQINFLLVAIFIGAPAGGIIAELAMRATQRRRARNNPQIATAATIIGGLVGGIVSAYIRYDHLYGNAPTFAQNQIPSLSDYVANDITGNLTLILFVGIVAFAVYTRYRMNS